MADLHLPACFCVKGFPLFVRFDATLIPSLLITLTADQVSITSSFMAPHDSTSTGAASPTILLGDDLNSECGRAAIALHTMIGDSIMKLLIASLVFGLVIASPAFAKPQRHVPAAKAFAYVPVQRLPNPDRRTPVQHSPNPNWDVYSGSGKYIGSDPDIRIRQDILKDNYLGHGGAH